MDEGINPLKQLLKALEARSAGGVGRLVPSETSIGVDGELAGNESAAEHNVPLGSSFPSDSRYLPEIYDAQKDIGTRRDNGALKLKKLRPMHKKVLALHLAAWPNDQIARELHKSAAWISTVINDPLAQEVLNDFDAIHEGEFSRLRILANSALRDALQPTKTDSTRLRAARIFYQKDSETKVEKGETAEDVMAKILTRIEADNVQINFNLGT